MPCVRLLNRQKLKEPLTLTCLLSVTILSQHRGSVILSHLVPCGSLQDQQLYEVQWLPLYSVDHQVPSLEESGVTPVLPFPTLGKFVDSTLLQFT